VRMQKPRLASSTVAAALVRVLDAAEIGISIPPCVAHSHTYELKTPSVMSRQVSILRIEIKPVYASEPS
jgi:hypothetical protein